MRPIHLGRIDKVRPVLVLTRDVVRPHRRRVTVAPISTTVRGLATEVPVGVANGVHGESVVNCDNIVTIPVDDLGEQIGVLLGWQETALTEAICAAFDLE